MGDGRNLSSVDVMRVALFRPRKPLRRDITSIAPSIAPSTASRIRCRRKLFCPPSVAATKRNSDVLNWISNAPNGILTFRLFPPFLSLAPAVSTTSLNAADRRVVVTGMGIVSCLGNTLEDVTKSLHEAESGITFQEDFAELGIKKSKHQ